MPRQGKDGKRTYNSSEPKQISDPKEQNSKRSGLVAEIAGQLDS